MTVGWRHRLDGHELEQTVKGREARRAAVHRVAESQTRQSDEVTAVSGHVSRQPLETRAERPLLTHL